eukprot:3389350-Pleurochrysis_carterae.AAC.1
MTSRCRVPQRAPGLRRTARPSLRSSARDATEVLQTMAKEVEPLAMVAVAVVLMTIVMVARRPHTRARDLRRLHGSTHS